MQKEEMVVAIIAITAGSTIAITVFKSVFGLVNKWLDRKNGSSELNQKFFEDYLAFKKEVLSQLEYVKTTGQVPPTKATTKNPPLSIPDDFEEEIIRDSPRLKNMLSQKK